jgi:RNA polymerase sigma-70 factor (ECF subfamily)
MTPLRELQLVDAYRQGGQHAREALGELLWGYQRRIYSICYRMLKHPEDASDVTQDVLLKIMEGLESYDGRSKLSTWVIRVTINCCLSFLRREKVRSHSSLDAHDAGNVSGGGVDSRTGARDHGGGGIRGREHSAGRGVEQEQNRAALVRALNSLDEESRALLVLRDLQDLDYQQLAEVFELPLGTVKSRLFRARESLRTALEGMGL